MQYNHCNIHDAVYCHHNKLEYIVNIWIFLQTHMQTGSISQNSTEIPFKVKNGSCSLKCSTRRWAENSLTRSMTSEMSPFISWWRFIHAYWTRLIMVWKRGRWIWPHTTEHNTRHQTLQKQNTVKRAVLLLQLRHTSIWVKEQFRQKWKFCHYLLTSMSCMPQKRLSQISKLFSFT